MKFRRVILLPMAVMALPCCALFRTASPNSTQTLAVIPATEVHTAVRPAPAVAAPRVSRDVNVPPPDGHLEERGRCAGVFDARDAATSRRSARSALVYNRVQARCGSAHQERKDHLARGEELDLSESALCEWVRRAVRTNNCEWSENFKSCGHVLRQGERVRYALIEEKKMVSRSGFYGYLCRPETQRNKRDAVLVIKTRAVFDEHKG